jgi:DNA-binding CsgD family transcriptional regulator
LAPPFEEQVSETSIAPNRTVTGGAEANLPVLLPTYSEAGLASNANPTVLRLNSQSGDSILAVLDSLSYGGFLLNLRGRVLSLNRIARSCLGFGLMLNGERLRATDRAIDRRLQAMIGSPIAQPEDPYAPTSVAVQRRLRTPLVIRVVRLDIGARAASSAGLLLLAIDPELSWAPPHEALSQAFGFTPAEAEVAIGIASGKTLAEIAADRGVTLGTARVLLKRVFSKTYTRGQAELTGLLTRLALLIPQVQAEFVQPPCSTPGV